jgi:hypothetical protein
LKRKKKIYPSSDWILVEVGLRKLSSIPILTKINLPALQLLKIIVVLYRFYFHSLIFILSIMKNETNFNVENLDVLTDQELSAIKGGDGSGQTIEIPEKKVVK